MFICAAGHAGSTLLNLLLGAHPRGLAVGEITHLPKNISIDSTCSCGEPISRCEFWASVVTDYGRRLGLDLWNDPYALNLGFIMDGREIDHGHQTRLRMFHRKVAYGSEYARLRWGVPPVPGLHHRLKEAAANKTAIFDFLLERTKKDFVIDSSKHYVDGMHLYRAAPDRTKIVALVRDGRAVFNSGLRRGLTPEAAMSAWKSPYQRSLPVLERNLPRDSWTRIHYEDLASRPTEVIGEVCDFLGLDYQPEMLVFQDSGAHIANGNRMRLRNDKEIRLDERWRSELAPEMLSYFEDKGGDLNQRLGYAQ